MNASRSLEQGSDASRRAGWTDPAARDKAIQAARAAAPPGPRRVFVGKAADRAATVSLADANGKARLVMKVEPDGSSSVDFLDADGKVVRRLGPTARQ